MFGKYFLKLILRWQSKILETSFLIPFTRQQKQNRSDPEKINENVNSKKDKNLKARFVITSFLNRPSKFLWKVHQESILFNNKLSSLRRLMLSKKATLYH